jgi:cytochrome c peroxidase
MKTRKVVMLVALLASVDGCAVDGSDASDTNDVADDSTGDGNMMDESTAASDLDAVFARHGDDRHNRLPNNVPVGDPTGVFTTVSSHGFIDLNNEFFQDLGTNGRRCVSCHVPTSGWTITPRQLQTVFDATDGGKFDDGFGLSAVFRTVDGSNSPDADVSTLAKRRQAYSQLLTKGLIRIHLPIPANAEFDLIAVDDPYHHATAADLSLFRRPPPTTNLKFDSTIMWDGRENAPGQTIAQDLATQANDAHMTHAQGKALTQAQRESIVDFTTALATAQIFDRTAGDLRVDGAQGGPNPILAQEFHIGVNDNFGDPVTGKPFNPVVFTIFDRWANIGLDKKCDHDHDRDDRCRCDDDHDHRHGHGYDDGHDRDDRDCHRDDRDDRLDAARRSVARGQAIFNTRPIKISGVSGINDEAAFGKPAQLIGTCTTCHDTPNSGNHSVAAPLNIGLADASRRTPDMPLYTLRNKTTGEIVKVTDPGRALVDGKWAHIGRFKGPILRDLAPRAPYFHNGFAKDFDGVIDFYEDRFDLNLSKQERIDLIAFLRSL